MQPRQVLHRKFFEAPTCRSSLYEKLCVKEGTIRLQRSTHLQETTTEKLEPRVDVLNREPEQGSDQTVITVRNQPSVKWVCPVMTQPSYGVNNLEASKQRGNIEWIVLSVTIDVPDHVSPRSHDAGAKRRSDASIPTVPQQPEPVNLLGQFLDDGCRPIAAAIVDHDDFMVIGTGLKDARHTSQKCGQ